MVHSDTLTVGRAERHLGLPPGPQGPSLLLGLQLLYRYGPFTVACRDRYGKTYSVRVPGSPPLVITTDTEAVPRIFKGDPLARESGASILEALVGTRSLIALPPDRHLERRKVLAPNFHGDRMYVYTDLAAQLVDKELDSWRVGAEINVHERAMDLTFKVIMTAIFGVSDPVITSRLTALFQKIMSPSNALAMFIPGLARNRSRLNLLGRRYQRLKDELDAIVTAQIEATRSDPHLAERDDVLALLIQARDEDGEGFDNATLLDELIALLAGGHETTATAIAWVVDLLMHDPEVLARTRAAVAEGDDDYLDAVIKESLRLRQPIPLAVARHFLEPFEIGDWTVDEKPTVIVDIDAVHHDPDNYSDPEAFRPERFLDDADEPTPFTWIPFGGGAHRCMGAAFAMLEMRTMLRSLLARYELAPVSAEPERAQRRGVTQAPRRGARVRVVAEYGSATREA